MNICEPFMKKMVVFCLIVGVVLLSGAPPVAAANVNIPDVALRAAINGALGANRAADAAVTEAEMKTLTSLTAQGWGNLSDLTGLEKATNLTTLHLGGNSLTDISALSRLTNLTTLHLWSNSLTDISALSRLTNLTTLHLGGRSLTDISALSRLTNLTTLDLWSSITDISVLSRLTNLTWLDLSWTGSLTCQVSGLWSSPPPRISNISALSGLTNLTRLSLIGQDITDISALSGLTKLTHLYLGGGRVHHAGTLPGQTADFLDRGLPPLAHQTVDCGLLGDDDLSNSSISDLSPLASNTGLGTGDTVYLSSQSLLSYPSLYTHIPALKTRGVTVSNFTNRVPTTLTKVSGDAQIGATSTALANPFIVEVKDGGNLRRVSAAPGGIRYGIPSWNPPAPLAFAGVPVTFAVTGGGGTLSATTVATDATGRAQTTLTLGSTTGTNTVTATVTHAGRTLSVSFTANANNRHPTFTSAATFSVVENTPATTAVGTVAATDADSQDSVTYSLTGADSAKFAITNAGILTFNASPDYDTPGDLVSTDPANAAGNNEYIIVVTATSGSGARQLTATQTLTITVTDVNEAPAQPAVPTVTAAAATPTQLSVSWTAPTNTGPAITDYDVRHRADVTSPTGDFTDANYTGTATSMTLTDLKPSTSYQVQVRAVNAEGISPWSDAGTAKTAAQPEDVDNDGDVDINDLVSVISNFGSASPGRHDVDNDNDVDAADIRQVFNAWLAAEQAAAGAPAQAARRITHTAEALHHYVQQTKRNGMLDGNLHRGLTVLEELIEPFLTPDETALLRNYPNPFNPETWFPYQLAAASDVTFAIYSVNGTLVRTLSLGYQAAGVYRHRSRAAYWDGRNAYGEPVASGIYFYTLTAGDFMATGKMLIRK